MTPSGPRDEALQDPRFADIFFFDAIIFNTDRHLGNFGYLIDNDTNEIVGAAPIFDNGYGLFSLALYKPGHRYDEYDDLRKFVGHVTPALYDRWLGYFSDVKGPAGQLEGIPLQTSQVLQSSCGSTSPYRRFSAESCR